MEITTLFEKKSFGSLTEVSTVQAHNKNMEFSAIQ